MAKASPGGKASPQRQCPNAAFPSSPGYARGHRFGLQELRPPASTPDLHQRKVFPERAKEEAVERAHRRDLVQKLDEPLIQRRGCAVQEVRDFERNFWLTKKARAKSSAQLLPPLGQRAVALPNGAEAGDRSRVRLQDRHVRLQDRHTSHQDRLGKHRGHQQDRLGDHSLTLTASGASQSLADLRVLSEPGFASWRAKASSSGAAASSVLAALTTWVCPRCDRYNLPSLKRCKRCGEEQPAVCEISQCPVCTSKSCTTACSCGHDVSARSSTGGGSVRGHPVAKSQLSPIQSQRSSPAETIAEDDVSSSRSSLSAHSDALAATASQLITLAVTKASASTAGALPSKTCDEPAMHEEAKDAASWRMLLFMLRSEGYVLED